MNHTAASTALFSRTPTVNILNNHSASIRMLQYNIDSNGNVVKLISRSTFSNDSRQARLWDARLYNTWRSDSNTLPNALSQTSLTGQTLRSDSVDAGWGVMLFDAEGRAVWETDSCSGISRTDYDTLGRPVIQYEQASGEAERISDRYIYGDSDAISTPTPQTNNLCGQLIRHYDESGLVETFSFTIQGAVLITQQQLLADAEGQGDWQGEESTWPAVLSATVYTTSATYNAQGAAVTTTDAKNNQQRFTYDVAGTQTASYLTLSGGTEQTLLNSQSYSAAGQKLQEMAGNGVVTTYGYEPQNQRLTSIKTSKSDHTVLQDLTYGYDPVGNITALGNGTVSTRYFNNQATDGTNTYTYDALYQLITATGRENAKSGTQGPDLPAIDANNMVNYTRTYTYDAGGNMTQYQHAGATTYTNALFVDANSNRALAQDSGATQATINNYFDGCGNVSQMQAGIPLVWNIRSQLQSVVLLSRDDAEDDREVYQYRDNSRIRKQTRTLTNSDSDIWQVGEVIYLPGLELRTTYTDTAGVVSEPSEELHVVTASSTGRAGVRVLHWETEAPTTNDQVRYSVDNNIGSSMLELDSGANILTQEEYYPFGGTAVWAVKNETEAKYKVIRYSGKERDNTGLYYYGHRYYAPWLCRWLNPDPSGIAGGVNLYCMVMNNPVTFKDMGGLAPLSAMNYREHKAIRLASMSRDFSKFTSFLEPQSIVKITEFATNLKKAKVNILISLDMSLTKSNKADQMVEILHGHGIKYVVEKQFFILDAFSFPSYSPQKDNERIHDLHAVVKYIISAQSENKNSIIGMHCGDGDGRSGVVKSAYIIYKYLNNSDPKNISRVSNYQQEIIKENMPGVIKTEKDSSFKSFKAESKAYSVVQEAIKIIRKEHPEAVERVADVAFLNAYAKFVVRRQQKAKAEAPKASAVKTSSGLKAA
ncbi:RHS repeat protein [Edaphovirga cremea]|uniref:RHS repeat protein n=1 Tax=Edaphovirga cremea TaxID=2267246 RepID=UPI00130076EE|nr:RHS repeat-associated core domain-containing protein [Edaphovirga cremea]